MSTTLIISGANRGIGLAVVRAFVAHEKNVHVIALCRRSSDALVQACENVTFSFLSVDFASVAAAELETMLTKHVSATETAKIVCVVNAGVVNTEKIGQHTTSTIRDAVSVNTIGAMELIEAFVRITQEWALPKILLGVSSGAARRPIAGWFAYCASKAGMEMGLKVLHEEQKSAAHPIRVCSYGPGVVMTEMQDHIQGSTADFPIVGILKEMHEKGPVFTPEECGAMMVEYMASDAFGVEPTADAYDLKK